MTPCPRCGEPCGSAAWAMRHCTPWRIAKRTGYRKDSERHREVRLRLPRRRRIAIARLGGTARKAAMRTRTETYAVNCGTSQEAQDRAQELNRTAPKGNWVPGKFRAQSARNSQGRTTWTIVGERQL